MYALQCIENRNHRCLQNQFLVACPHTLPILACYACWLCETTKTCISIARPYNLARQSKYLSYGPEGGGT